MVCQVRLLARMVARHKGIGLDLVMVFVDKLVGFVCKTCGTMVAWLIFGNLKRRRGLPECKCATKKGIK